MSHQQWLLETRTKLELAQLLVKTAKAKAQLEDRVHELEYKLFWLQSALNKKEKQDVNNS